jgi:hypothetical protein
LEVLEITTFNFAGLVKVFTVPVLDAYVTVTYADESLDFTQVGEMCHIPLSFHIAEGAINMDMIRVSFTDPNGELVTPEVRKLFREVNVVNCFAGVRKFLSPKQPRWVLYD